MAISQKVQDQIVQYQQLEGQIESLFMQKSQVSSQMAEVKAALDTLGDAGDDATIYEAAGNILVKRQGKAEMVADLESRLELLDVKLKSVEKQEKSLRTKYSALQKEISDAITTMQAG